MTKIPNSVSEWLSLMEFFSQYGTEKQCHDTALIVRSAKRLRSQGFQPWNHQARMA